MENKAGEKVSRREAMGSWGTSQKYHDPRYEAVTSPLKDIEECGKSGGTNDYAESPTFQYVCKKQGEGGLVKTVLLLKDEGLI
jgi:hypothetical protein